MKDAIFTIKYFLKIVRAKNIRVMPAIYVGLIASFIGLTIPWFAKIFIDDVLIGQNLQIAFPLLAFWFLFEFLRTFSFSVRAIFTENVSESIVLGTGVYLLKKIHRCSKLLSQDYGLGNMMMHISDINTSGYVLMDIFNEATEIIVYLIAMPFAFLIIDPYLALIVGSSVLLCVLSSCVLSRVINKLHTRKRSEEDRFSECFMNIIRNTYPIRSSALAQRVIDEIYVRSYRIKEMSVRKYSAQQISRLTNRLVFMIGNFLYRIFSVYLVYDGKMTVGDYFAYNTLLSLLFSPIELLSSLIKPLQEMMVNSRRMQMLLSYPEQTEGDQEMPECTSIAANNVYFRYNIQDADVIPDFNYKFERGTFYGLAGHNGCGKSTIMQLIARHFTPYSGSICIESIPIDKIKRDSYHAKVAYIPSVGIIFPTTFEKNIILSTPYDKNKYSDILAIFGVDTLKDKFISDYELFYGGKQTELSSGENQMICISRALYNDYQIYMFDESFSHLDSSMQCKAMKAINKMLRNKIVIVASHDISVLRELDIVLCMSKGKLVELGDVEELQQKRSIFAELFGNVNSCTV